MLSKIITVVLGIIACLLVSFGLGMYFDYADREEQRIRAEATVEAERIKKNAEEFVRAYQDYNKSIEAVFEAAEEAEKAMNALESAAAEARSAVFAVKEVK